MFNNSFDVTMQSLETTCPENDVSILANYVFFFFVGQAAVIWQVAYFVTVFAEWFVLQAERFARQPVAPFAATNWPTDTVSKST